MSDQQQNFNGEASRCPLCGGDNQCAIAAGLPAEGCWCQSVTFTRDALDAAADYPGRCICPACAGVQGENRNEG